MIEQINPYDFVALFLDNIVNIETGIHIEIKINTNQNDENRSFLSANKLEIKNPISTNSNTNDKDNNNYNEKVQAEKETLNKGKYSEDDDKLISNSTTANYNNLINETVVNKITISSNDKNNNSLLVLLEEDKKINVINSNQSFINSTNSFFNENLNSEIAEFSKDKTQEGNDGDSLLHIQEISYDNRDPSKPFININPQANEKMKEKLRKTDPKEVPITIILLDFENLQRMKFKTKFHFTYNFIKSFYRASAKKMNLDLNNLREQEKINIQSQMSQNIQAFQFLKFFPSTLNFSFDKNFSQKHQSLLEKIDSLGFLTMFGATDLNLNEIEFNRTSNAFDKFDRQMSKSF